MTGREKRRSPPRRTVWLTYETVTPRSLPVSSKLRIEVSNWMLPVDWVCDQVYPGALERSEHR